MGVSTFLERSKMEILCYHVKYYKIVITSTIQYSISISIFCLTNHLPFKWQRQIIKESSPEEEPEQCANGCERYDRENYNSYNKRQQLRDRVCCAACEDCPLHCARCGRSSRLWRRHVCGRGLLLAWASGCHRLQITCNWNRSNKKSSSQTARIQFHVLYKNGTSV